MSRLCDRIEARQTDRVKLMPASPTVVAISEALKDIPTISATAAREYRLEAKFGVSGFCSDVHELTSLKNMAKRQIIEEVFGEFRPLIRKIELALYYLDVDGAKTALRELENEMMG